VAARIKCCIFCGGAFTGQKRNFEHIIPAWLVEEADLRRRDMPVRLPGISREIPMSRIGLKVCKACNDVDSDLEARAKDAYQAINAGQDLTDSHLQALLDWLDKVRVGLWLWLFEQVSEEFKAAEPKFRINGRLARKDRMVLIQRYPEGPPMRGLALHGVGEFFMGLPSAIGMLINNVALTSASSDFLVLRHIRDVRVLQRHTTGNLTGFELVADALNEPRLKFLGGASIFAQCIMPDEDFPTFGIPAKAASPHAPGWSESGILRLDQDLRETSEASASVPIFTGNVAANEILMERNVYQAAGYLVRDLKRADPRALDDSATAALTKDMRRALAEITEGTRELDLEYQMLTGLRLH